MDKTSTEPSLVRTERSAEPGDQEAKWVKKKKSDMAKMAVFYREEHRRERQPSSVPGLKVRIWGWICQP